MRRQRSHTSRPAPCAARCSAARRPGHTVRTWRSHRIRADLSSTCATLFNKQHGGRQHRHRATVLGTVNAIGPPEAMWNTAPRLGPFNGRRHAARARRELFAGSKSVFAEVVHQLWLRKTERALRQACAVPCRRPRPAATVCGVVASRAWLEPASSSGSKDCPQRLLR
jgi:hypothetical protein